MKTDRTHVNAERFRQQRNFLARFNPVSRINSIGRVGVYAHVRPPIESTGSTRSEETASRDG